MVAVPPITPDTTPSISTVATEALLLLHEPPVVAFANDVADPAQTLPVPVIAPGSGFTVTIAVVIQPLAVA
jgi:hypothetical protein